MRVVLLAFVLIAVVCGEKAQLRTPGNGNGNGNGNGSPKCVNTGVRRKLPNIARTNGLTDLANLLEAFSLTSALNGAGPFTVFAPTNAAFANSGLLSDVTLTAAQATHILLHHVVSSQILSSAILNAPSGFTEVQTLAGTTLKVTVEEGMVKIDGYAVVTAVDVLACNGVAHVIDHVLIPPCGNANSLPTIAARATVGLYAPLFTTLASIVTSTDQEAILAAISGAGPLTLFAPVNAAFTGIPPLSETDTNKVLLYHALSGRVIASDIPQGSSDATTLLGQTVALNRDMTSVTVEGAENTSASNVVAANVQACNGVVHAIDQVLLPELMKK